MRTTRGPPPGPAVATASGTPSPLKSAAARFTDPTYPGPNGAMLPFTDPSESRHWMRLRPSADSPTPTTAGGGTGVGSGACVGGVWPSPDGIPLVPPEGGGAGGGGGVVGVIVNWLFVSSASATLLSASSLSTSVLAQSGF